MDTPLKDQTCPRCGTTGRLKWRQQRNSGRTALAATIACGACRWRGRQSDLDPDREGVFDAPAPRELAPLGELRATQDEWKLAAGLLGLASMIEDYFCAKFDDGAGGLNEPDESDPACHLWNAANAVKEHPDGIQVALYAEHEPRKDDLAEVALIEAGRILDALDKLKPATFRSF